MTEFERNNGQNNTAKQIVNYYSKSPGYFEGPLRGACHFGFTPEGEEFDIDTALRSMEKYLGDALALPSGSTVFDAGCGFGRVATTLSKEFDYKVIGIDLMHERLKKASEFTETNRVADRVKFINGDYCKIPLPESSVDGVFTMETLVHAERLEDALSDFRRVLKPGGRLTLFEYSVPENETLDPVRKFITDAFVHRTGMASIGKFTHGAFPEILDKSGFENIKVEEISDKVQPTWEWMFKLGIREIPKNIVELFRKDPTNWLASLLIWPYRNYIGYNVVTANKPYDSTE